MKQQDCLRRFLFEQHNVRGEWVRLERSWQQAKQHQVLVNEGVDSQLGQALAAVTLLSATIKFNGAMILQAQGNGDLKALVAQATSERTIRGLVRSNSQVDGQNLKQMLGDNGRLVLTIESDLGEPFQGIVGIEGDSLADVVGNYFRQSEQLETRLWLFADSSHAAGLFIQELPGEKHDPLDWERICILADTVSAEEMFTLDCEQLLHRLFHEDQVRLYEPEAVAFRCNCSRSKISNTLLTLGRGELEAILRERDDIEVDCQFCGQQYRFDKVDVEGLLKQTSIQDLPSPTRH